MVMRLWNKWLLVFYALILGLNVAHAAENSFQQARALQRDGRYDEAIEIYKRCLLQPVKADDMTDEQLSQYNDALLQLMNTFQSKGEPETCVETLQEIFNASSVLQNQCLRDYYSVMGYALSRTENMKEAEETMIRVFALPLYRSTPERLFRDYAYAAAVFYSNTKYQREVINWCKEALVQAELCNNTSSRQWVEAMLGSIYKRQGLLTEALELFQQSLDDAQQRDDDLSELNSLNAMIDLFLYWDVPEYANMYASEAVSVERELMVKNPMISAQTYINKGRALQQLGEMDSVQFYVEQARMHCQALPYNSGMVDVNLLNGTYLTENSTEASLVDEGIEELLTVTRQATSSNRAKAYHYLARAYLRRSEVRMAESMLDSMYVLVNQGDAPIYINIDYRPIIDHYLKTNNHAKVEQYARLMMHEQEIFKQKRLNLNLAEAVVDLHTEQKRQELRIAQLELTNQRLWFFVIVIVLVISISVIIAQLYTQRKRNKILVQQSEKEQAILTEQLTKSNAEKEVIAQEMNELLSEKGNRQEVKNLTPTLLQKKGESKFRQRFEVLYPRFLDNLREKVPSITRREELLSMLIVLKQDNKEIAELLSIAPRSVLMLRHRFRQKVGMASDGLLEDFIEGLLRKENSTAKKPATNSKTQKGAHRA